MYETTILGLGRELRRVPSLISKAPKGTAEMVRRLKRIFTKRDAEDVLSLAERGKVYLRTVNEWVENILSKEGIPKLFFKHGELTTDEINDLFRGVSFRYLRNQGIPATASILDKGKTWFMNTFGREVGDAILGYYRAITFDAIKRISSKYPDVVIKYLPQGGDEALILVVGKSLGVDTGRITKELTEMVQRDMEAVLSSLAKRNPEFRDILRSWAEVSNVDLSLTLKMEREGNLIIINNEKGVSIGSLYDELSRKESDDILRRISMVDAPLSEGLRRLRDDVIEYMPLHQLSEIKTAEQAQEIVRENGIFFEFRLELTGKTREDFLALTQHAGKGVYHVQDGLAGASVFNLLGHGFTDKLRAMLVDEIIGIAKKRKLDIKVRQIKGRGPFTLVIEGVKGEEATSLLRAAEKNFREKLSRYGLNASPVGFVSTSLDGISAAVDRARLRRLFGRYSHIFEQYAVKLVPFLGLAKKRLDEALRAIDKAGFDGTRELMKKTLELWAEDPSARTVLDFYSILKEQSVKRRFDINSDTGRNMMERLVKAWSLYAAARVPLALRREERQRETER